jgi:hypothetical protein
MRPSVGTEVAVVMAMARNLAPRAAVIAGALTLAVTPSTSRAQQPMFSAAADVMSGVEGGGTGYASGVRRARTTLRLGVDAWIDESPNDLLALAAIVELEPRASIGADLRYTRLVSDWAFHAGAIAIIAPRHMIGATLGVGYRIPVGEMLTLSVGPTANVYFLGADLPERQVVWQGMLQGGIRVGF